MSLFGLVLCARGRHKWESRWICAESVQVCARCDEPHPHDKYKFELKERVVTVLRDENGREPLYGEICSLFARELQVYRHRKKAS